MNETIWSLDEANALVPDLIALTEAATAELRTAQAPWAGTPFRAYDAQRGVAVEDAIRAMWARAVAALGAQPKGYFVADFQSPDPDTLWCWSFGEQEITHEHKLWETFSDRRPIPCDGHDHDNYDGHKKRDDQ